MSGPVAGFGLWEPVGLGRFRLVGLMDGTRFLIGKEDEAALPSWPCIAYRSDGAVCRVPGRVIDRERGGVLCDEHARKGGSE